MQIIRAEQFRRSRWRNGRGYSAEILASPASSGPADLFVWRFALADITEDGPFSIYEGVDRIFTIINGHGVTLAFSDGTGEIRARPFTPVQFSGDAALHCTLNDGPCQALNLFALRTQITASVVLTELPLPNCPLRIGAAADRHVFIFALSGTVQLGPDARLYSGEAALLTENTDVQAVDGPARLYLATLMQNSAGEIQRNGENHVIRPSASI